MNVFLKFKVPKQEIKLTSKTNAWKIGWEVSFKLVHVLYTPEDL